MMRDPIHTTKYEVICIHAYVHVAYIPTFIPVHNVIVYTCTNVPTSCEQAMYCTHLSVWSVELWASSAAMCCAPSSCMDFSQRLNTHVCVARYSARVYLTMRDPIREIMSTCLQTARSKHLSSTYRWGLRRNCARLRAVWCCVAICVCC
jgi:hypothetical protein